MCLSSICNSIRCDQTTDCYDVSDEKGCKIIVIDPKNYLKDKPPKQGVVKVHVKLLKILKLDEVSALFSSQYSIKMEWMDSRLTFYNLHGNQGLNTIVEDEKQMIWTPSLILENTNDKPLTIVDRKSIISVRREGNFTKPGAKSIDNIYIFKGDENPLEMTRLYQTGWICDYQMNW